MKLSKKRGTILRILSKVDAFKSIDENIVLWPYVCCGKKSLFVSLDKTSYLNKKPFLYFVFDKNL